MNAWAWPQILTAAWLALFAVVGMASGPAPWTIRSNGFGISFLSILSALVLWAGGFWGRA